VAAFKEIVSAAGTTARQTRYAIPPATSPTVPGQQAVAGEFPISVID